MAVTREGIPVRVWSWPGNTADAALIGQVKEELREWALGRVVWTCDRGFASQENRRLLRRGDDAYIMAEKLRGGSAETKGALARAGRYQELPGGLRVKKVRVSAAERFIVCRHPEAARRDEAVRARLLARLEEMIAGSDRLSATKRVELRGVISTKPGLARLLRTTAGGLLRVAAAAIKTEQKLDGTYLLRSSDPSLSAADIALGYKQLWLIERAWRDMKQVIDLRPVYHRKEERIRAHVVLCWLALLLVRTAENACGDSWPNQRSELTSAQRAILSRLELAEPARITELAPAAAF